MINAYLQFVHTGRANNCTGIVKMISTSYQLSKELPKNLKGRRKSSQEWLMRQLADPYVEKARRLNYRYYYLYDIKVTKVYRNSAVSTHHGR